MSDLSDNTFCSPHFLSSAAKLHKFTRRIHKTVLDRGGQCTISDIHEGVAQALGVKNYNDLVAGLPRQRRTPAPGSGFTATNGTMLQLGRGAILGSEAAAGPIALDLRYGPGNLLGFGTSRVGKTSLIRLLAHQNVMTGDSVLVLDLKGDIELQLRLQSGAAQAGRSDEFMILSLHREEQFAALDPFDPLFTVEEMVCHVTNAMEHREPFFTNVANELLTLCLGAKRLLQGKEYRFTIGNVRDLLDHDNLQMLRTELLARREELVGEERQDLAAELARRLTKLLSWAPDYFSQVTSGLRVALIELETMQVGSGTGLRNEFVRRLAAGKPFICLVQAGSLIARKSAATLLRLVMAMITTMAERRVEAAPRLYPRTFIYLDEAHNYLLYNSEWLYSVGNRVGLHLFGFCQSIQQLEAVLGKERADGLLLNNDCAKLCFRVPDAATDRWATEVFGCESGTAYNLRARDFLLRTVEDGAKVVRKGVTRDDPAIFGQDSEYMWVPRPGESLG